MIHSIDKNIRFLRKAAGLTQEQLAQKLFVTRQTVSLWENGKSRPDIEMLEKISSCLQVDLLQILYGPEYTPIHTLPRRLFIWALFTSGTILLSFSMISWIEWCMVQPFFINDSSFFLIGNFYLFVSLFLCPVLPLSVGISLGHMINQSLPHRKHIWSICGLFLSSIPIGIYVIGITHSQLFLVGLIAWKLQQNPWLFFPIGFLLYYFGRGTVTYFSR